jgi:hypothetical protein
METTLRAPAVPLVTVDPYFSVWSMADRLTDDFTRHWTGKRHAMTGLILIDGKPWRFAGKVEPNAEQYYTEPQPMTQKRVRVTPLSSIYEFEAAGVRLQVRFTTPLLLDDLDLLSRPASYAAFTVGSADGKPHRVQLYYDVSAEWCVDTSGQQVVWREDEADGRHILQFSHHEQQVLNRSGDDHRIDWGQFYLAVGKSPAVRTYIGPADIRKRFVRGEEIDAAACRMEMPQAVRDRQPVLAFTWDCGEVGEDAVSNTAVLAYDDLYAIEYFGEKLKAYWKRGGLSAFGMIAAAFDEYEGILERCDAFDRQLMEDAVRAGGEKYADLLALAYRQAIAAHKLVLDPEGRVLFMSKECFSNGCIATVDVSYPSVPLFLLYNPELVKGMMRPIFKYSAGDAWPFDFAPHDVGQYPLAGGQVYGDNKLEAQMPVEECGNMLIMAAAVTLAERDASFAEEHWGLLSKWAEYLLKHGLDPEHQLCTDDFAGHLARNANLSVKAIMGLAGYALMLERMGRAGEAERWRMAAGNMAERWKEMASEGDHTRLAFGADNTWSLKYNLVWDLIFGTRLFGDEVPRTETAWYLARSNRYGTPLDNRAAYTKADWVVWAASLSSDKAVFERLIEPLWRMLNETPDRVPFTDWYDTVTSRQVGFQHRSVVGGIFIQLLKEKGLG